ncbi:hypothetical protein DPMN_171360 [Dreissena polymorpha]|uniref:Uncharacterized protein n=1 Tax=Dreissena polymorpha TaxID=45954 RepID=A0A9D4E0A4_DREPO|nr:hypothetical protein DPMN_171360 [Dreissena polymorpha]
MPSRQPSSFPPGSALKASEAAVELPSWRCAQGRPDSRRASLLAVRSRPPRQP